MKLPLAYFVSDQKPNMKGSGQVRIRITPVTFTTSITQCRAKNYPVSVPRQFALQF